MSILSISILLLTGPGFVTAQKQVNDRALWFTEARFGMFIHWGVYSGAGGIWKGEKLRNDNDYAEWIMYRNLIDRDEYLTLIKRFDWNSIDPEEWVILAKKAGMKYLTFTAKHHDGFALWKSDASDYNVWRYSQPQRDILKELAEACKKNGIKLGLYYSHWIDWEHEYGWKHSMELTGITPADYDIYWQEKVIPQVRELLTQYGEISIFWFDMWINHSETVVTREQLLQLKGLIRELQPQCIINSRLGLSIEEDPDVDFKTLGDNRLGNKKEDFPWQSPVTVAHSWGFHSLDTEWKSTTTLLKSLINNVSLNGNLMLNIGPGADGEVPPEITRRLLDIGEWLRTNGEAIYGAGAADPYIDVHDWGRITAKSRNGKTILYLHVFNRPPDNQLILTGVLTKPERAYLLSDKDKSPIPFTHTGVVTKLQLSSSRPDNYISVIAVEYGQQPEVVQGLALKTGEGGYSLTPANLASSDSTLNIRRKSRSGTIPEHVRFSEKQELAWRIYVEEPGNRTIDVSYSFQGKNPQGSLRLKAGKESISHNWNNTGKTVGEPNSNWVIDAFRSYRIGTIHFPEQGFYDIVLEIIPAPGEDFDFQWIWIK